uniref:RegC n=1 Tax=Cereibacter sphaeroides TaxID=1063 RepID=Q53069_CERSP|nr:RegC [Cereibacter sphaeroides]
MPAGSIGNRKQEDHLMTKLYAGVAAAAIAALLAGSAGVGLPRQIRRAVRRLRRQSGGGRRIGGPFTLVDQEGRTVTDREVLAKPSLVYFGYTFCPDVCPFDMARNAQAVDILTEWGIEVTPVFISIDPKRDTPEQLKFLRRGDPSRHDRADRHRGPGEGRLTGLQDLLPGAGVRRRLLPHRPFDLHLLHAARHGLRRLLQARRHARTDRRANFVLRE